MPAAPNRDNEIHSLAVLRALDVLDTAPEAEFDALVRVASSVCGVPISLISLIDTERQWFKANIGLPGVTETPRDVAFCAHGVLDDELLEVPDATQDLRFADNPLVTGQPDIRFYAGAPLCLRDGTRVGTLCVIDRQARRLTATQRAILTDLAAAASQALEGRAAMRKLDQATRRLAASESLLRLVVDNVPAIIGYVSHDLTVQFANRPGEVWFGAEPGGLAGKHLRDVMGQDLFALNQGQLEAALRGEAQAFERVTRGLDGQLRHSLSHYVPAIDAHGVAGLLIQAMDVTNQKDTEAELRATTDQLREAQRLCRIGSWEWDPATDTTRWSEELHHILGCDPKLPAPTFAEHGKLYKPQSLSRLQQALGATLERGEPYLLELQFELPDGRTGWIEARGGALRDAQGKIIQLHGTAQDISERVQQRRALTTAHERMAMATEAGGIGVWEYSLAGGPSHWDARMFALFGLPAHSTPVSLGEWEHYLHPDDRTSALQSLRSLATGGGRVTVEFRVVWPDGSVHHLVSSAHGTLGASGKVERMVGVSQDVTPLRRATAELKEQHELLRVTLQSIGDAVITTDSDGIVEWLNPIAERLTGWMAHEAKGRPLAQVFHIVNQVTHVVSPSPVDICLAQGSVAGLASDTLLISRDGSEYGIEDSASPIRSESGAILGVVLVFHDVSEQRRLSGEMTYRATHDALTGLVNRAEFEARLTRLLHKAREEHSVHALLYIDLDQFKLVNDACGHSVGDQLLQQVSKLLADAIRNRDTLARLGGDEFAIILEHCTVKQAHSVAQKICDQMDHFRFTHGDRRFRIGTSIGLVPVDRQWTTTSALQQAADTACYAAKDAGRNRVHAWFDSDAAMHARQFEMQWTSRIERALDDDAFVLFAQRIQPLQCAAVCIHAEILLRMQAEDGSLVLPGAFLPAAERFHLASRVDRWVLRKAFEWMAALSSLETIELLSVNLSGRSVGDRAFHAWATRLLAEAGPAIRSRLCLEITETAAVTNLADAAIFIDSVRSAGVKVALDDFGAGASSFGYLKSLPVDFLKIDGQFIRNLVTDPLDQAAVRCFADVARVVGVKSVAEFVDQPEVLQHLRNIGVDFAQGFLIHRPEPIDRLLAPFPLTAQWSAPATPPPPPPPTTTTTTARS